MKKKNLTVEDLVWMRQHLLWLLKISNYEYRKDVVQRITKIDVVLAQYDVMVVSK